MSDAISAHTTNGDAGSADARANQLLADTAAIVARSLHYMPRDAFWEQRYAERAKRFATEDAAFHVRYLADAVRASSATVMEQYARWLRDLLVPRGMCTLHLVEHLDHIGRAVVDCVGDGRERDYIQHGLEALKYDSAVPRTIQDVAGALAVEIVGPAPSGVERHSAFETTYLCHYAADALQRGTPELLLQHVDWSRKAAPASGIDSHAFESWFTSVRSALRAQGLPDYYLPS